MHSFCTSQHPAASPTLSRSFAAGAVRVSCTCTLEKLGSTSSSSTRLTKTRLSKPASRDRFAHERVVNVRAAFLLLQTNGRALSQVKGEVQVQRVALRGHTPASKTLQHACCLREAKPAEGGLTCCRSYSLIASKRTKACRKTRTKPSDEEVTHSSCSSTLVFKC